jgi:hypothetical protein
MTAKENIMRIKDGYYRHKWGGRFGPALVALLATGAGVCESHQASREAEMKQLLIQAASLPVAIGAETMAPHPADNSKAAQKARREAEQAAARDRANEDFMADYRRRLERD